VKPSEVREKSKAELDKLVHELEEDVFRLEFRRNAGQLKQTSSVSQAKRDLARVKTILREKAISGEAGV